MRRPALALLASSLLLLSCHEPGGPCPDGDCVNLPPLGWSGPVLLWAGKPAELPECPDRAPNIVYEGHDYLMARARCPVCSCGPSACQLPGVVADSAAACATDMTTPYPAPEAWNGSCFSNGIVEGAALTSIYFPPLTQAPCEPQEGVILEQAEYGWGIVARACQSIHEPLWCNRNQLCAPYSDTDYSGFWQCIYAKGDESTCPLGYPSRRVFFTEVDANAAGCSPCTCGPPEGGVCSAMVAVHEDPACLTQGGSKYVTLQHDDCLDVQPGTLLRGMSATWIQNEAGTCTPAGGDPTGEIKPAKPSTFCCTREAHGTP